MDNQKHCMSIKRAKLIVNAHKHNLLNSFCNNGYVYVKQHTNNNNKNQSKIKREREKEPYCCSVSLGHRLPQSRNAPQRHDEQ